MNEQTNELTNEWTNEQMNEQKEGRKKERDREREKKKENEIARNSPLKIQSLFCNNLNKHFCLRVSRYTPKLVDAFCTTTKQTIYSSFSVTFTTVCLWIETDLCYWFPSLFYLYNLGASIWLRSFYRSGWTLTYAFGALFTTLNFLLNLEIDRISSCHITMLVRDKNSSLLDSFMD